MKKNAFLLTLSVALVSGMGLTSLASCGESSSSSVSDSGTSSADGTKVTEAKGVDSGSFDVDGVEGGATGAYQYVSAGYENRTNILGKLEGYAYNNNLTGLPLFEDGGYAIYNPRIQKGTTSYINGFGYGILSDGKITADLSGETNAAYKRYYHNAEANDPASINALNSDGSQISDLYGNIGASYWSTKMNDDKTGYEWYGSLAKESRPIAIEKDPVTGLASKWKFHVRTGADGGVKYRTEGKHKTEWDNKDVVIDDYVNAFKVLLTKKNGLYRGAELAKKTDAGGIVGASAYYNASANGYNAEAWAGVGITTGNDATVKEGETEKGDYIIINTVAPTTEFYAMYNFSSNLYTPLPADFITAIGGVANYGNYSPDKSSTPVDNILSLAPYTLEEWVPDQAILFKKNDSWFECKPVADGGLGFTEKYTIPGIYTSIISAQGSDANAYFNEFLNGKLDGCSIPADHLEKYRTDSRTVSIPGSSVFKLNMNTTTEEQWVKLFGVDGSIAQTAESNYWKVKPWMSNKLFLNGLMKCIDREAFAAKYGSIASCDYFGTGYMSNPETGESYNSTQAHKEALIAAGLETADSLAAGGKKTYGFDLEDAKTQFSASVDELIAAGKVKAGDTLNIDIWWMYTANITKYGADIKTFIEDAFNNSTSAKAKNVKVQVNNDAGAVWSDVYYKHLMVGQFDLGFGSISGNTLNPLNFMEVLKSNNSSGFTLNWGPDTSKTDASLSYDNEAWSFDTLWKAADQGIVVNKGAELPPMIVTFGKNDVVVNADGSVTVKFSYKYATDISGIDFDTSAVEEGGFTIYDGTNETEIADNEEAGISGVVNDATAQTVSFKLSAEAALALATDVGGFYIVGYYSFVFAGATGSNYCMATVLLG